MLLAALCREKQRLVAALVLLKVDPWRLPSRRDVRLVFGASVPSGFRSGACLMILGFQRPIVHYDRNDLLVLKVQVDVLQRCLPDCSTVLDALL